MLHAFTDRDERDVQEFEAWLDATYSEPTDAELIEQYARYCALRALEQHSRKDETLCLTLQAGEMKSNGAVTA